MSCSASGPPGGRGMSCTSLALWPAALCRELRDRRNVWMRAVALAVHIELIPFRGLPSRTSQLQILQARPDVWGAGMWCHAISERCG